MHQRHCDDRTGAVGDGAVPAHRGQDDDAPDQEDEYKFKGGHLRAWPADEHTYGEQKEEVSDDGAENCARCFLRPVFSGQGTTNMRTENSWLPERRW